MKEIYADGACKGNPGEGGWGVVCFENNKKEEYCGYGGKHTTNIRMEMTAIIEALKLISENEKAIIYTDSLFAIQSITQWIEGWKKKNWRNTKGEVKNKDLWMEIDSLIKNKQIEWVWVKGHNGNIGNELADQLANLGIQNKK